MLFDQENPVVQLCTKGMECEMGGHMPEAKALYGQAWQLARDDHEKFIAAHYLARQQPGITGKLQWDKTALVHAQRVEDAGVKAVFPSLHLNIAKGYEDLGNIPAARRHYLRAQSFIAYLPGDGYGKMISAGIHAGLERTGGPG